MVNGFSKKYLVEFGARTFDVPHDTALVTDWTMTLLNLLTPLHSSSVFIKIIETKSK